MDVSVLGPLEASESGLSIVPTAAKPRTLLALLAAYAGQVTPVDVIVAELWEEDPPQSAFTTIQTYVLQLRRLIESALQRSPGHHTHSAKCVLRTEPGGYVLNQSQGCFDLIEHERLAARGYDAIQAGDFRTAKRSIEAALALWRGSAFVDVVAGPRLSAQAALLEESRRTLLERRIEADLRLGRHHELIGELAGLTAQHTTDERLHEHFMVALYRAGRRSEALHVFRRLRSALAEELGIDPTPSVLRLHQCLLMADPVLEAGSAHR